MAANPTTVNVLRSRRLGDGEAVRSIFTLFMLLAGNHEDTLSNVHRSFPSLLGSVILTRRVKLLG